jgi:hypothetical protein
MIRKRNFYGHLYFIRRKGREGYVDKYTFSTYRVVITEVRNFKNGLRGITVKDVEFYTPEIAIKYLLSRFPVKKHQTTNRVEKFMSFVYLLSKPRYLRLWRLCLHLYGAIPTHIEIIEGIQTICWQPYKEN